MIVSKERKLARPKKKIQFFLVYLYLSQEKFAFFFLLNYTQKPYLPNKRWVCVFLFLMFLQKIKREKSMLKKKENKKVKCLKRLFSCGESKKHNNEEKGKQKNIQRNFVFWNKFKSSKTRERKSDKNSIFIHFLIIKKQPFILNQSWKPILCRNHRLTHESINLSLGYFTSEFWVQKLLSSF